MKIFIHVGLPKAASTSLQELLINSRESLLNQGVFVPLTGFRSNSFSVNGKTDGHDVLPLLALSHKKLRHFFNQIIEQASIVGCDRIILSSENLSHPANLPELEKFVRYVEASIVATQRAEVCYILLDRQDKNWLLSFYNEQVMDGRSFEYRTFEQFKFDMANDGISATSLRNACELAIGDALFVTQEIDISVSQSLGEFANHCGIIFSEAVIPHRRVSQPKDAIEQRRIENQFQTSGLLALVKRPVTVLRLAIVKTTPKVVSQIARRVYRSLVVRFFLKW